MGSRDFPKIPMKGLLSKKVPPILRQNKDDVKKREFAFTGLSTEEAKKVPETSSTQRKDLPHVLLPSGPQLLGVKRKIGPEHLQDKGKQSSISSDQAPKKDLSGDSISDGVAGSCSGDELPPLKRLNRGKDNSSIPPPPPESPEEDEPVISIPRVKYEVTPVVADELKQIKTSIIPKDVEFDPSLFDSPNSPPSRAALATEQLWSSGWSAFSLGASPTKKLLAAKAMNIRALALIGEVESSVSEMQRDKKDADTALLNSDRMLRDISGLKDQLSIVRRSALDDKNLAKCLQEDNEKLKYDIAILCKKFDNANNAQAITVEALQEANTTKSKLINELTEVTSRLEREVEVWRKIEEDYTSLELHMHIRVKEVLDRTIKVRVDKVVGAKVAEGIQNFKETFENTPEYEAMQRVFGDVGARWFFAM